MTLPSRKPGPRSRPVAAPSERRPAGPESPLPAQRVGEAEGLEEPQDGARGRERRGGSGDQAVAMVPGGSSEQPASVTAEIAVTSFHPSPVGGGILIGRDVDGTLRRAVLPTGLAGREPQTGETWRITGPERRHSEYGLQILASVALPLLPTGRAIVRYLATNSRFEGIGWATAAKLWDALGDRLYDAVREGDVAGIAAVVGSERAVAVVQGFGLLADEVEVFQWLDRYGVSPRTAAAAASLWGRGAIERIKADPYALALLEPWGAVDGRALRLGVAPSDPRRLLAAVEEALARRYRRGHTAADRGDVARQFRPLLGPHAAGTAARVVDLAVETGRVVVQDGLLQSRAAWFMEREVERILRERLRRVAAAPVTPAMEAAVADVEAREGYRLTPRQRDAVHMAVTSPVGIICGGAGTGKTTVVKAILAAAERFPANGARKGWQCAQVALAGRAAKRIAEATGREAMTVARFLRRIEGGQPMKDGLLVFDESSMLDLPSVYRILVAVPAGVDLLFIGNPAQLPPIGPGLLFQRMVSSGAFPCVELDVIHRQADSTGIAPRANAIRAGRLPEFPRFDPTRPLAPGVFLAPAAGAALLPTVMGVFAAMAGPPPSPEKVVRLHGLDIQVLCPTRHGPAGSQALNREIERAYMARQPRIHDWGLAVGSKVLWLKNDYGKAPLRDADGTVLVDPLTGEPSCQGFMNGALGVVRRATPKGAWLEFDDGAADEVRPHDLEKMAGGWAISVHKAQGSAFRRVIVPLARSRMWDRAMLYTAVTRAVETIVLVGDVTALHAIVESPPQAHYRSTTLLQQRYGGSEEG